MACPFFIPTEKIDGGPWQHPARLPLGAGWKGKCSATASLCLPSDDELRDHCNLGYAKCSHLPAERQADAVRFAIAPSGNGEIVVKFACEREHRPAISGTLTFDRHRMEWITTDGDPQIRKLADCYVHAYLDRKK